MAEKQSFDPGLTQQFSGELRRTINEDGSFNVRRTGAPLSKLNPYLHLVGVSWPKFILFVIIAFFVVNFLFAGVFVAIGIQNLVGADTNTGVGPFTSAFFFSVHTLTTVGYGSIYPRGLAANLVAALEAMIGLMAFALATGLLFARFSRPSARILFSQKILVTPYQDMQSIQFRIANQRNNNLMDVEAKVLLMTVERNGGELKRKFVDLPLERPKVYFFPLTWTVVHPMDTASPLYGKTAEELAAMETEFLILIKGFDDTFSQIVNARYSYRHNDLVWGGKFQQAFRVSPEGDLVLELDRVHDYKRLTA